MSTIQVSKLKNENSATDNVVLNADGTTTINGDMTFEGDLSASGTSYNIDTTDSFPTVRPSLLLDFANSKKLDPRMNLLRASEASYYDGTTIKVAENILKSSEDLSASRWAIGRLTVTADAATAPDGLDTADLLEQNDTTGSVGGYVKNSDLSSRYDGIYGTYSVFVKYVDQQYIKLTINNNTEAVIYDMVNGEVYGHIGGNNRAAGMTDVGNGWYRIWVTNKQSLSIPHLYFCDSSGATGSQTNGKQLYVWGWQAEVGELTSYTKTTTSPVTKYGPKISYEKNNRPRFDHDPVTGESLGLKIEQSRTNILSYSQEINQWSNTGSPMVLPTTGLDGRPSAFALTDSSNTSYNTKYRSISVTGSTDNYTASVYVLKADSQPDHYCSLDLVFTGSPSGNETFNIRFNHYTGVGSSIYSASGDRVSVGVEDHGAWWRIFVTAKFTDNTFTGINFVLNPARGVDVNNFSGTNGARGTTVFCAPQLEKADFMSSYIRTGTGEATRAADVVISNKAYFNDWYNQNEGTVFVDFDSSALLGAVDSAIITDFGNSLDTNDAVWIRNSTTDGQDFVTTFENGGDVRSGAFNITSGKVALGIDNSGHTGAYNGSLSTGSGTLRPGSINTLRLFNENTRAGGENFGVIKKLSYYPVRLTDDQIKTITEE
jgi:hypothetical protein